MSEEMNKLKEDVTRTIDNFDFDDIFTRGSNYFVCGCSKEEYYNINIACAIALIGTYNKEDLNASDYHNGIKYLANELKLSKRQIKILRKKTGYRGYQAFRTPYSVCVILGKIISWLVDHKDEQLVKEFISEHKGDLYRDVLFLEHYRSIRIAADEGGREKVVDVCNNLNQLLEIMEE